MTTFQHQDSLQKLPIPPIETTCQNYLLALKPLQTEKEHQKTVAAVSAFLSGAGPLLDSELRKYSSTRNSYIEQFWYDLYLNYDLPVVLNLNPFFLLEDDPFNNELMLANPQVKRAASLTLSLLKFIRALKNETLSVDTARGGKPLCMYQYQKLFGSARLPTEDGCVMQLDPKLNHIVVLSKSQFYWFDVLDPDTYELAMSEQELAANFASIVEDSLSTPAADIAKSSFGVLTTENRRIWARLRHSLAIAENPYNSDILSIVDLALFVLCLDDITLHDLSDLAQNMLCGLSILDRGVQVGTCTNRWYDKLQIIVTKNGKAGINFEHTGVDGHTVLRFVSDIYTDSILSFAHSINGNAPSLWKEGPAGTGSPSRTDLVTVPRKLEWDLTPDLSLALRFGETRLSDLINQNEFRHLEFKNYGSSLIKKMKYSPDAFVQMAFQATYYALYGKVECTYEPAMTKGFFHGRTEAIRTVLEELNLFVRKFFDASIPNSEKLNFLSNACTKHAQLTKKSSSGEGVDRHLYALFCIWKRYVSDYEEADLSARFAATEMDQDATIEQPLPVLALADDDLLEHTLGNDVSHASKAAFRDVPEIFADAGWDKLNNTVLSTSNCGNPALRLFGFGPVAANGFGIGYIIKDDLISICASSKHRQTERFLVTLELYLNEVYRIFKLVNEASQTKTKVQSPTPVKAVIEQQDRARKDSISANPLSTLLGGYGYFDMGDDDIKSRGPSPEPPFLNRNNSGFSFREIGKKLRLSEY